ncbi:uncharacterized protein [Physcomitrium patens]|nr:uncharacterized protein LOC112291447 [Physcomitrium patens]XP_024394607.1 uncharacterized protein LOC112291447 [Physcomitrium patens]PNR40875.1 hypothetical protein PHYPA_018278 [Physcomitrium patens]|eukprot:XP_024394606.1 uncharacterized protein LOC112291447 [Physcomitrella patens]
MEGIETDDFLRELDNYNPRQFDSMNPLIDLTSGRKNIMGKYLDLQEEEPWPLLAEYFGVALAFAALGALIRGANGNRVNAGEKDSHPKMQKMVLQNMLKGSMERLQNLARNAQNLQDRLTESTEAGENHRKECNLEKASVLQKLATAEEEVRKLKRRRAEDAKANEKVVRIYANREHGWKAERKKLCHEIDILRKSLIRAEINGLCSPNVSSLKCNECDIKNKRVKDLEKALKEQEFVARKIVDIRKKEEDYLQLTIRFTAVKKIADELKERLNKELANSKEREAILDEVRKGQQETEHRLMKALEDLATSKLNLESLRIATDDHSAMAQKLLDELATMRQESEDKDVMISTMLDRATFDREEKEDLARELAAAQAAKVVAEAESGRWKRLAAERTRTNLSDEVPDAGRTGHRSHRSLGNRSELEKIADLQQSHLEEVNNLCTFYSRQVEALEKQVEMYKAKARDASTFSMPALLSADLQGPLSDPTCKAWFEVVKGRFATQIDEKHWSQIETFERHLRAKDERLSAFRSKLITLESELAQSRTKVDDLGCNASTATNEHLTEVKIEKNETLSEDIVKDDVCVCCERMGMTHQLSIKKLQVELKSAKDELKTQFAKHETTVEKMTENAEVELRNKDVQLSVLEAKLCQVQSQPEESKSSNGMALSDKSQIKIFLENIDEMQAKQPEEVLHNADSGTKVLKSREDSPEKKRLEMRFDEPMILIDNSVSDSAKLLSKLKDICLREEKPPAMISFHRKLELESSDNLIFSSDDSWLTAEQRVGEMSLQFIPTKDVPLPEKNSSLICEDENVTSGNNSIKSESGRDMNTVSVNRKGKAGANKQPLSLVASTYHVNKNQTFDNAPFTQVPSKVMIPANFGGFNKLREHKSQHTLFTEMKGLQTTTDNPTFITQDSEVGFALEEERQKSQTREDIHVLGLALEVRRIEQQLSKMNKSIGDAQSLLTRPEKSTKSSVKISSNKQASHCMGLAGKVTQLAKQIGLTRPLRKPAPKSQIEVPKCAPVVLQSSHLCLRKNPLFLQETTASELVSLQLRAEKVGENLSAIQARVAKENSSDFYDHYRSSTFPKSKLVDTVRTHLSQVQGALHSKLTQTVTSRKPLLSSAPKQSTSTKASTPHNFTIIKPATTPKKVSSPTKLPLTPSTRRVTPTKPVESSPRRITSTKLLTPSPKSFTPSKPFTPAPSAYGQTETSLTKSKQVLAKTSTKLVKDVHNTKAAFGRKETKSSVHDKQPRQWARKTSTHYELDLEHLR